MHYYQIVQRSDMYLHRKGAAPADQGFVIIPGSRGSHSYIVKPKEGVDLMRIVFLYKQQAACTSCSVPDHTIMKCLCCQLVLLLTGSDSAYQITQITVHSVCCGTGGNKGQSLLLGVQGERGGAKGSSGGVADQEGSAGASPHHGLPGRHSAHCGQLRA